MFCIVLTAFLALRASFVESTSPTDFKGSCPQVTSIGSLQIKDFSGTWYEIGYYNRGFPYSGDCVEYNFSTSSSNEYGYNVNIEQNGEVVGAIDLKAKTNGQGAFDASLTYPLSSTKAGTFEYYVMTTDYDCFAVIYACSKDGDSHISSAYFLTRDRYGQCYILKRRGGTELEGKKIPDLEFEEFAKTKQVDCKAKEWKYNED